MSQLSREHARVLTFTLEWLPELSKWDNDAPKLEFRDLLAMDLEFDPIALQVSVLERLMW